MEYINFNGETLSVFRRIAKSLENIAEELHKMNESKANKQGSITNI